MSPRRVVGGALVGAAAAGAAAFAWGALVERRRFQVRHEVLRVLEPGSRDVTILHLSDLHMAPWQHDKQDFVRSLARYEPDLVIGTGDNLGHVDGLAGLRAALDPFRGVAGVHVHGSNDYYGPVLKNPFGYFLPDRPLKVSPPDLDAEALDDYLEGELGWLPLETEAHAIEIRGNRFEFFGTGDAHRGWDDLVGLPGRVEEMREEVEWSEEGYAPVFRVGVTHAPYRRVLDGLTTQGADLIVAGHTHGGQVRIPGRPALVTNCDIPAEQAQGLSVWRHAGSSAFLQVSAGLGTSIYAPVRFACPPEAIVLTLTAAEIGYD
ncbi:metallophosphoesterase [Homoserinibacter sp. YIM 151385]|uniref:metallophosphoesterase n=1 Tax=Homoserinibacter sp. YIM 151385 TaxID=2985506 RepID=UPI0022EFDD5E|nr:metallophosphoesterase [Homoserinibacter sp. YIM 151385]WBU36873.1 metallophosphoesterase [Homoserinibacter sp. YIM 151385]